MECGFFARLETHLTISFSRKIQLKRIVTAVIFVKQSEKSIVSIYNEFKNFLKITSILFASQPAGQPVSLT